jgi:hypothetical protein
MAKAALLATVGLLQHDGMVPCMFTGAPPREWALIMKLATRLEVEHARCIRWYVEDPIEALGGRTAAELVASGKGKQVIGFLYHASWCERRDMG